MIRIALTPEDEPEEIDRSVTVAAAAISLGVDHSTVRAMLRARQLSGHKVGKGAKPGGVRIHERSIKAYKRRHAIGGEEPADAPADRPEVAQRGNPAHREAMARLRQLGAV